MAVDLDLEVLEDQGTPTLAAVIEALGDLLTTDLRVEGLTVRVTPSNGCMPLTDAQLAALVL